MRFIVKKVNGVVAVFDTVQYRNVTTRRTEKAAQVEADKRNAQGSVRAPARRS